MMNKHPVLWSKGRMASEWIQNYFLMSEDVVVSLASRKEFLKVLDKWGEDPCLEKKKKDRNNVYVAR